MVLPCLCSVVCNFHAIIETYCSVLWTQNIHLPISKHFEHHGTFVHIGCKDHHRWRSEQRRRLGQHSSRLLHLIKKNITSPQPQDEGLGGHLRSVISSCWTPKANSCMVLHIFNKIPQVGHGIWARPINRMMWRHDQGRLEGPSV